MRASLSQFQAPILQQSVGQLAVTLTAYVASLAAMYASVSISPWLTLALALPTAGFVVRLFIIQHDCGHGSYFRSRGANAWVGRLCSMATLTPYADWRRQHATHHAAWNNLDARHAGADIYSGCATLAEYQALRPWQRFGFRALRHPLVAQIILPPFIFLALYRVPFNTPAAWDRQHRSVIFTNIALLCLLGLMMWLFGVWAVMLVQVSVIVLASIAGVWLFSVQHRFEDAQWTREQAWTPASAALHGCSWLRLPRVLQWITGNIGFHHVHHLMPRVPNYRLQACHEATTAFAEVSVLSVMDAFRAPAFVLWDEASGRMVPFPAE